MRLVISVMLLAALAIASPAIADPTLPDDAQNPAIAAQVMPKRCTGGLSLPARPGACRLTKKLPNRPTVVLWGDSHAWQHIPGLRAEANARRVNLVAFVMGACPPMVLQKPPRHAACVANAEAALDRIKALRRQGADLRVVLGAHWQFYRGLNVQLSNGWTPTSAHEQFLAGQARLFARGNLRLFNTLGRLRVRTAVIGQVPWVPADRADCVAGNLPYRCDLPRSQAIGGEADVRAWLKSRMRPLQRPWSIDVTQRLCNASVCRAQVGGAIVFLDDLHLNPDLSRQLREYYQPALDFDWS